MSDNIKAGILAIIVTLIILVLVVGVGETLLWLINMVDPESSGGKS